MHIYFVLLHFFNFKRPRRLCASSKQTALLENIVIFTNENMKILTYFIYFYFRSVQLKRNRQKKMYTRTVFSTKTSISNLEKLSILNISVNFTLVLKRLVF